MSLFSKESNKHYYFNSFSFNFSFIERPGILKMESYKNICIPKYSCPYCVWVCVLLLAQNAVPLVKAVLLSNAVPLVKAVLLSIIPFGILANFREWISFML